MANSNGVEQQIIDYILQAQKHGLTDLEIKQNLLNAGWEAAVVESNFVFAKASESKPMSTDYSRPQQHVQESAASPSIQKKVDMHPLETRPAEVRPVVIQPSPIASPIMTSPAQPENIQPLPAKPSHKKLIFGVVVFLLLCAGGAAYGYYEYYYNRIEGVWKRMASATPEAPKVYKTDYDFSYNFTYKENFDDAGSKTKPGSIGVKGNLYQDSSNANELKLSNELNLVIKDDTDNFSFGLSFMLINKVFYLDLGRVQFLKGLIPGKDLGWIKIDFDSLSKYAEEKGTKIDEYKKLSEQTTGAFDSFTFSELVKSNVIRPGIFIAKEDLNGVPVYHFKNEFHKETFLPIVFNAINKDMAKSESEIKALTTEQKKIITAIVKKMQVKEFETWVGQKDFTLHKVHLVLSAPSITDFVENSENLDFGPLETARAKSRDAKRLGDIRQYATALELYYNDNNGYPAGSNGEPTGLAPMYMGELAKSAEPVDGSCTDYYNSYWYEPAGQPIESEGVSVYPSYSLTFCLGGATGGHEGGIAKLTPQGIEANIPCPTKQDECVNSNPRKETNFEGMLAKWKFDAEIKFDVTYKDFGKTENIVPPSGAEDIVDIIKDALGEVVEEADDAKRLSDIRKMASGLELYFNDFNSYPSKLNDLTPTYISEIPTPPAVVSGTCSAQDNAYTYNFISAEKYSLTFCLGSPTGGYSAGKHTLTQAGIQ